MKDNALNTTEIINALIENPSAALIVLIGEPLPSAMLAYFIVWLIMRPHDKNKIRNSFSKHSCGIAIAVVGSAIFRIIAMITFAGYGALDPSRDGNEVLAFYYLILPALIATGYIAWLKKLGVSRNSSKMEEGNSESLVSGFNPFRCTTEITNQLSIALLSVVILAWFTWIGVATDGFSGIKVIGWFLIFGIPFALYIAILILLPILRKTPKSVRFMISASLLWGAAFAILGYIFDWNDEFTSEKLVALFFSPPIGGWLVYFLWKWSNAD